MSIVVVKDLKKSFRSPDGSVTPIVDIPAFGMEAGAHVGLQGSSGSGKTTFLNMLAGILKADSGSIQIAGEELVTPLETVRDSIRGKRIGYIFQTFNLLQSLTALENIELGMMFGIGLNRARAKELLSRVGLKDRENYYPRQLSIGQQQRVAVARALANKPDLVLADEPTGNLDRLHAVQAINLIREISRENNSALLVVSHDQEILDMFTDLRRLNELNKASAAHSINEVITEGHAK